MFESSIVSQPVSFVAGFGTTNFQINYVCITTFCCITLVMCVCGSVYACIFFIFCLISLNTSYFAFSSILYRLQTTFIIFKFLLLKCFLHTQLVIYEYPPQLSTHPYIHFILVLKKSEGHFNSFNGCCYHYVIC